MSKKRIWREVKAKGSKPAPRSDRRYNLDIFHLVERLRNRIPHLEVVSVYYRHKKSKDAAPWRAFCKFGSDRKRVEGHGYSAMEAMLDMMIGLVVIGYGEAMREVWDEGTRRERGGSVDGELDVQEQLRRLREDEAS